MLLNDYLPSILCIGFVPIVFCFIKTFLTTKLLASESYKTAQNQNLCGKRGKLSQHYTGTIPSLLQKEIGHRGGEA